MSQMDQYVAHALKLIQVSNGQNAAVSSILRQLQRRLATLIRTTEAHIPGRRRTLEFQRSVDALILDAYTMIATRQARAVAALVSMEAEWAGRAGRYDVELPSTASTIREFTVLGNTIDEHWQRQAANLRTKVIAEVRLGQLAGQSNAQIVARVAGTGPAMKGGLMEVARRDARGVVDATTHSAADAGRRATMKAAGVNAVKWMAILDPKVCVSCGERAGKLWTIDGEAVGHNIPYASPVLHPWCRCILLPMKYPDGPPEDGGKEVDKFENWLKKQSVEQQNDTLGKGRADLWRDGKVDVDELIGQNGMVMTLRQLQAEIQGT